MAAKDRRIYQDEGGQVWETSDGFKIKVTGRGGVTTLFVGYNGGMRDDSGEPVRTADMVAADAYLKAAGVRMRVDEELFPLK